jgi:DNA-binding Lrp family transcriptional regulator
MNIHQRLLNEFQRDFPLSPTPYADIAQKLGVTEDEVLSALQELVKNQSISRIGAIVPPNSIGVSLLAALAVPSDQFDEIAEWVSSLPEVNHNYEREHCFNLWFVVNASHECHLEDVLEYIEQRSGLTVLRLPLLEAFHIDLGFPLEFNGAA